MSNLDHVRDLDRRKLYRKVASEHDLLIGEVEAIVESQFEFLAETIREGDYDGVRLPFLGKFWVKEGRIKHVDRMLRNSKKRQGNDD